MFIRVSHFLIFFILLHFGKIILALPSFWVSEVYNSFYDFNEIFVEIYDGGRGNVSLENIEIKLEKENKESLFLPLGESMTNSEGFLVLSFENSENSTRKFLENLQNETITLKLIEKNSTIDIFKKQKGCSDVISCFRGESGINSIVLVGKDPSKGMINDCPMSPVQLDLFMYTPPFNVTLQLYSHSIQEFSLARHVINVFQDNQPLEVFPLGNYKTHDKKVNVTLSIARTFNKTSTYFINFEYQVLKDVFVILDSIYFGAGSEAGIKINQTFKTYPDTNPAQWVTPVYVQIDSSSSSIFASCNCQVSSSTYNSFININSSSVRKQKCQQKCNDLVTSIPATPLIMPKTNLTPLATQKQPSTTLGPLSVALAQKQPAPKLESLRVTSITNQSRTNETDTSLSNVSSTVYPNYTHFINISTVKISSPLKKEMMGPQSPISTEATLLVSQTIKREISLNKYAIKKESNSSSTDIVTSQDPETSPSVSTTDPTSLIPTISTLASSEVVSTISQTLWTQTNISHKTSQDKFTSTEMTPSSTLSVSEDITKSTPWTLSTDLVDLTTQMPTTDSDKTTLEPNRTISVATKPERSSPLSSSSSTLTVTVTQSTLEPVQTSSESYSIKTSQKALVISTLGGTSTPGGTSTLGGTSTPGGTSTLGGTTERRRALRLKINEIKIGYHYSPDHWIELKASDSFAPIHQYFLVVNNFSLANNVTFELSDLSTKNHGFLLIDEATPGSGKFLKTVDSQAGVIRLYHSAREGHAKLVDCIPYEIEGRNLRPELINLCPQQEIQQITLRELSHNWTISRCGNKFGLIEPSSGLNNRCPSLEFNKNLFLRIVNHQIRTKDFQKKFLSILVEKLSLKNGCLVSLAFFINFTANTTGSDTLIRTHLSAPDQTKLNSLFMCYKTLFHKKPIPFQIGSSHFNVYRCYNDSFIIPQNKGDSTNSTSKTSLALAIPLVVLFVGLIVAFVIYMRYKRKSVLGVLGMARYDADQDDLLVNMEDVGRMDTNFQNPTYSQLTVY